MALARWFVGWKSWPSGLVWAWMMMMVEMHFASVPSGADVLDLLTKRQPEFLKNAVVNGGLIPLCTCFQE